MSVQVLVSFFALMAGANAQNATSSKPPMGWNSYNHYGCNPSEDIIKMNAQGLVDLGFADLGYTTVTTDCGWNARDRDVEGRLQWNETLFPSGGKALGEFIHGLGLKFGLYSGAGYLQCGSEDLPASLGYEDIDAQSFAEWGGDSLKYDNCYSTSDTQMVDADSEEAQSSKRFEKMAASLEASGRNIAYWICQWGIGYNVPEWASKIGQTWRMSNDIYNDWRSIWRIVNQVVPHAKGTKPGSFADMDMLIIGLGALSYEEERFHFGMWSLMKSPLLIGGLMNASTTPQESFAILSNEDVIAIDQDELSEPAELILRYTEEEWDLWAGNLSDSRKILGVANWKNETQTVGFDLSFLGIASADGRDVWAAEDMGALSGPQELELAGHELKLIILSDISDGPAPAAGTYHSAGDASLSGPARLEDCDEGECLPAGQVIRDIVQESAVTFEDVEVSSAGSKLVGIDFINYDYAFHSAWGLGSNTRNMTISVNEEPVERWAFPLAGNDWFESGRVTVEVGGFVEGRENEIVFRSMPGSFAPDIVGFEIYE